MTNPTALDQAVREVTTPTKRAYVYLSRGQYAVFLAPSIRARYRQIVAEGGYMLPREVHDLDAGPSRIIQRS
jgi:hypothetical protein